MSSRVTQYNLFSSCIIPPNYTNSRTFLEILHFLSEKELIHEVAFNYLIQRAKHTVSITGAFTWANTPIHHDYWYSLHIATYLANADASRLPYRSFVPDSGVQRYLSTRINDNTMQEAQKLAKVIPWEKCQLFGNTYGGWRIEAFQSYLEKYCRLGMSYEEFRAYYNNAHSLSRRIPATIEELAAQARADTLSAV